MDHRVFTASAVPAIKVPSERLIEFFADAAALQMYLESLDIANANLPLVARQQMAQQALLDAAPVKTAPTAADLAQQHQPVRPFVVYQPMAMQQQGGTIRAPLTPEQRAVNAEIRQRQYEAQVAMLPAKAAPAP